MGPIDCSDASVRNYHNWLRNSTEARISLRPDFCRLICCYSCLRLGHHKLKLLNNLSWTGGVTASMPMRSSLFWDVTQRRLVVTGVLEHPSGLIFKASWAALPLNRGPIACPRTSLWNSHSALRNIADECRCGLHRGGPLSHVSACVWFSASLLWPVFTRAVRASQSLTCVYFYRPTTGGNYRELCWKRKSNVSREICKW